MNYDLVCRKRCISPHVSDALWLDVLTDCSCFRHYKQKTCCTLGNEHRLHRLDWSITTLWTALFSPPWAGSPVCVCVCVCGRETHTDARLRERSLLWIGKCIIDECFNSCVTAYHIRGHGGAGGDPSWHWAKAGFTLDRSPDYHRADT